MFPPQLTLTALPVRQDTSIPSLVLQLFLEHLSNLQPMIRLMDSAAGHCLVHSNATRAGEESSGISDHSCMEEDATAKGVDTEADKHGMDTISDEHAASDGKEEPENPPTQDTLTGVSQVFGMHEDFDSRSNPREKV